VYDVVVRMKGTAASTLQAPEYYGTKTDIVGGSLTIAQKLKRVEAKEYWIFLDSRHFDVSEETFNSIPHIFNGRGLIVDKEFCDAWDARYRELRDTMGGQGHNHTSQGFKAILYALEFLRPDELDLAGFDNVMTGRLTWSVTRGPDWQNYPSHRWDVERDLLKQVAMEYPDTTIRFITPEEEK